MCPFSQCAETHLVLEARNIECVRMILMLVSFIPANETLICSIEVGFADCIGEVEFFKIVYKHILSDILDSCYIATDIDWLSGIVVLRSSVSDNFLSPGPIFGAHCPVMVALYPKSEVALGCHHRIICLFVIVELL